MYMTASSSAPRSQTGSDGSRTVVASHERIAVAPPQLPVHVLLRLLQGDVHVAIDRLQLPFNIVSAASPVETEMVQPTLVNDPGIKLDRDRRPDDLAEEARGIFRVGGTAVRRGSGGAHLDTDHCGDTGIGGDGCEMQAIWRNVTSRRASGPCSALAPRSAASCLRRRRGKCGLRHERAWVLGGTTIPLGEQRLDEAGLWGLRDRMSLFKKPAWAKTETSGEETPEELFSHSGSYAARAAEERRQRRAREEGERRREEKRRIRQDAKTMGKEERGVEGAEGKRMASSPKRRRITLEEGADLLSSVGLPRPRPRERTPGDEVLARQSPRIDKAREKARSSPAKEPVVVELGDSSEAEGDAEVTVASTRQAETAPEQDSDDEFAELARQARARNKLQQEALRKAQSPDARSPTPGQAAFAGAAYSTLPVPDPPVKILVSSEIPHTRPLMVMRKVHQRLQEVRQVWCAKQGFSDDFADKVFLTYRGRRLWDVTTCRSLGLSINEEGVIVMKGAEGVDGVDQVHLEAMTEELFAQAQADKDREAKKQWRPDPSTAQANAGAEQTPEVDAEPVIRILLMSKNRKEPFKLKVKPACITPHPPFVSTKLTKYKSTPIHKIISGIRSKFDAQEHQTLHLEFDGERLSPDQVVQDTEIVDLDRLDVHIV